MGGAGIRKAEVRSERWHIRFYRLSGQSEKAEAGIRNKCEKGLSKFLCDQRPLREPCQSGDKGTGTEGAGRRSPEYRKFKAGGLLWRRGGEDEGRQGDPLSPEAFGKRKQKDPAAGTGKQPEASKEACGEGTKGKEGSADQAGDEEEKGRQVWG